MCYLALVLYQFPLLQVTDKEVGDQELFIKEEKPDEDTWKNNPQGLLKIHREGKYLEIH